MLFTHQNISDEEEEQQPQQQQKQQRTTQGHSIVQQNLKKTIILFCFNPSVFEVNKEDKESILPKFSLVFRFLQLGWSVCNIRQIDFKNETNKFNIKKRQNDVLM